MTVTPTEPPAIGVVVSAPDGTWEPAVRSLLGQSAPPAAVTVVTPAGASPDPRLRFVPCTLDTAADACVEAARALSTAYVAFLHGRDEPLPHWLCHLAGAVRDGVGLVTCGTLRLRPDDLVDGIALTPGLDGAAYAVRRDLLGTTGRTAARVMVPRLLVRRRSDDVAATGSAARAAGAALVESVRLTAAVDVPAPAAPRRGRAPDLVSVVIPVRDGALTLPAQLRALAAQEYPGDWEVLVVDNGSTDATREVAEKARPDLPGLRIVDAGERAGEGYARNRGIAAARGDLIAFCDADDVADPGWLAALTAAARDADLVGGSLDSSVLSPAYADEQPMPMTGQTDFLPFARGANCAAWKDVLTTIGGWDEQYRGGGEDMDLSWRAHLCGYRVGYAPDARMHYRLRAELTSLARQKWNYGRSGARLYAAYRHAGFERRDGRTVLMNWSWLLLHTPDLARSPTLRRRWIRYGARLSGFLAGSAERGVRYL
ncbi:glycosyl transferase family protein [Streptomyces lincolnensis]|uniref:Glycosyl transferase family protein n=1 Tax=Streptomyces lincolnensis TaxID=1915 RepID=A0A1B1MJ76_STRLN|nr:glycosyltransferase [Streptomyces lincolnensis]ANS68553.1 glycosyl transferase family protein [Streptomyces lincolnensis]AXG53241.1 glycosyl transferase family protein [Streptomyces lincolnensis]